MEKKNEIEITEIVIKVGKKEIRLSPDDAEKLHGKLSTLFKERVIERQPYCPYPSYPYYPYRWTYTYPQIECYDLKIGTTLDQTTCELPNFITTTDGIKGQVAFNIS